MTTLSSTTADNARQLLDYQVVDNTGAEIGTVHSFWANAQSGQLEYLGVKTGWLFGHNHVVPVDRVELDEAGRVLRVPYTGEFLKGAPSIDADATISDEEEAQIHRYYQTSGTGQAFATSGETALHGETAAAGASVKHAAAGTVEVPLTEEEVKVGKRKVDAGQVRLRKIVRTEVVNQPVEVRHEDVVVERVAADQVRPGTAGSNFKEETIDVPLTREEVVVAKDAHVTGAVRLHKTEGVEQRQVSETVRKEDVEVLRDGKTVTETGSTHTS